MNTIEVIIGYIIFCVFAFIILTNMIPAINSQDQAAIDKAAGRTIDQITNVGAKAIEEEVKTAPLHSLIDIVTK